MVVVQTAIPTAMNTSIGPEVNVLTQRQAMTTGKRLSKSLNYYRAYVTSVQTNASLEAIFSLHETKPIVVTKDSFERETHTFLSMSFWFYLTKVMTLFVPRLEYNSKSKFSRNHITMAEIYFCFEGKDEHMFRSNTVKIMTILLFRVSKFFRV